MRTADFDYDLPDDLIASKPSDKRDHSRLLVLDRSRRTIEHKHFYDISDHLGSSDILVLNDTKVIPARLIGKKTKSHACRQAGGGKAEILLLKKMSGNIWECMVFPYKRLKEGTQIDLGKFTAVIKKDLGDSRKAIEFFFEGDFDSLLKEIGRIPLPPYIVSKLTEAESTDPFLLERYQTVYAEKAGASAAPTAGLHFTPELLAGLKDKGVEIAYITLHTGMGTFKPVTADMVKDHKMASEEYEITAETASKINSALKNGKRPVAVGTTVTRCLEDCLRKNGSIVPIKDSADIFIYPPFDFKVVKGLITNFHFPKSTLLMLVSAFAGKGFILEAYREAIKERYRFFSFGDAMMIL
ncbi:MAG: tRNA preQ1(34) S-adenosylmethionine ribosyltransferase-isomerase QueA [Candidatus Margulisiibacteriota bacterium]